MAHRYSMVKFNIRKIRNARFIVLFSIEICMFLCKLSLMVETNLVKLKITTLLVFECRDNLKEICIFPNGL